MTLAQLIPELVDALTVALSGVQSVEPIAYDDSDYVDKFEAAKAARGLCVVAGYESGLQLESDPLTLENRLVVGIHENRPTNALGPSALTVAIALAKALGDRGDDGISVFQLASDTIESGEPRTAAESIFFLSLTATTTEEN